MRVFVVVVGESNRHVIQSTDHAWINRLELRAVVEFYFVETTFIFGINLLVTVPTTLRSVWFASYPSSKRLPA